MNRLQVGATTALLGASMAVAAPAHAQPSLQEAQRHIDAARAAAGTDHTAVFALLCPRQADTPDAEALEATMPAAFPSIDPERPWYAEPTKVFDNLYFVGQTQFTAWAVTTSEGIIIIDPIFEYSVEAEVADGLRKLGFDPADIRYVVVSHGHADHVGGAAFLQDTFGARVVMSEEDWDLVERSTGEWKKPRRDIIATDGMQLKLGDTTLALYHTPGHTPGTISTILPVRDGGKLHVAALWGGTLFNFRGTPDRPRETSLAEYASSAERFRALARAAGADVFLSNHTRYDGSTLKIPALASRGADDPHPYVIGIDAVERFFTVAEECARAARVLEEMPGG